MRYKLVVCGGTFDHLHEGHKAFLRFILSKSQHVVLGLTSNTYIEKYKQNDQIQPFEDRKKMLEEFFIAENAYDRVEIASIDSVFYPAKWESYPLEAIMVTEDTKKGAEIINVDRVKKGLTQLPIVIAPFLYGETGVISSSNIRSGHMNSKGELYIKKEWFDNTLVLPEEEREQFHNPFGQLLTKIPRNETIDYLRTITVGDVVTKDFNERNIGQILSVIDFTIQRKKTYTHLNELGFISNEKIVTATNPSGHITPSLFSAIREAMTYISTSQRTIIQVIGEEDLAVLPLILTAPLGFVIFYGQPNKGLVRVDISQKIKDHAMHLMEKFTYDTRGY